MTTPAATSLTITQSDQDQRPVLVLVGELDDTTSPQFSDAALEIVNHGARDVIVDAQGVALCDASGLAVFKQIAGRLRSRAGRLAIVPSPPVQQALEAGELTGSVVVASSVAGALYAIHRDHP